MQILLLSLYVVASLIAALSAIKLVTDKCKNGPFALRMAFVLVGCGSLSNAVSAMLGLYPAIAPGPLMLNLGVCGVLSGMAWGGYLSYRSRT